MWRSCRNPPQRGPCIKILTILCSGACMKVVFRMLKGSSCMKISWAPLDRIAQQARSCGHAQPHLLLFHSFCCLYLVHWLPTPHTDCVSCQCHSWVIVIGRFSDLRRLVTTLPLFLLLVMAGLSTRVVGGNGPPCIRRRGYGLCRSHRA